MDLNLVWWIFAYCGKAVAESIQNGARRGG
jgi:hypothetical protein